MQQFERVLLYLTALGVAAALLLSPSHPETIPESSNPGEGSAGGAPGTGEPLVLKDKSGKARLEIRIDEDGEPRLSLLNKGGEPAIVLATRPEGGGELSLRGPRGGGIYLQSEPDGAVEIVVIGHADSRAILSALPGGQLSLEFNGPHGVSTRMVVSAEGETEIGVGGSQEHPVSAFLRTDRRGLGEISVRGSDGASGTSMTVLPSGEMGIVAVGLDGKTGPMMQLQANGLAQVSVSGTEGRGVLIVAPERPAMLVITDSNGRPIANLPSQAPAPPSSEEK